LQGLWENGNMFPSAHFDKIFCLFAPKPFFQIAASVSFIMFLATAE
jgi:hypothetical protein